MASELLSSDRNESQVGTIKEIYLTNQIEPRTTRKLAQSLDNFAHRYKLTC